MSKAFMHPIGNRPIVVQRGKDLTNGLEYIVNAFHIQESLLLTGKRGIG